MIEKRRALKINQNEDYLFFIDMNAGVLQINKEFGSDMADLSVDEVKVLIGFLLTAVDEL